MCGMAARRSDLYTSNCSPMTLTSDPMTRKVEVRTAAKFSTVVPWLARSSTCAVKHSAGRWGRLERSMAGAERADGGIPGRPGLLLYVWEPRSGWLARDLRLSTTEQRVTNSARTHVISIVLDRSSAVEEEQRRVRVQPRRAPKRSGLHRNQNFEGTARGVQADRCCDRIMAC